MSKLSDPTAFLDQLRLKPNFTMNSVKFDPSATGSDKTSPVKATTINLSKKLSVIECPWEPTDPSANRHQERYANFCLLDSMRLGEAPFLMYQLLTKVLNTRQTFEHNDAFFFYVNWIPVADVLAVYIYHGITASMQMSINIAKKHTTRIEYRVIGKN